VGLAASPLVPVRGVAAIAVAAAVAAAPWAARPAIRLLPIALFALAAGLVSGSVRLASIDAGALAARPGERVSVTGIVAAAPRAEREGVSFELATSRGRLLVTAPFGTEVEQGAVVRAAGGLAEPDPWRASALRRRGIALTLHSDRVEPTGERRDGLAGRIDTVRARAERGLERGMAPAQAALARGFVLGQDDRIDPATREDFRRSGLAHLLAVSGQNVMLLCLLAWPFMALAGLPLRARLLALLALIALYVPVAGAGPSIQRAAVMGGAGLVATLASRPGSRTLALLLAAVLTLALNPLAAGDVGWQLSFAAVVGILLWCGRLATLLAGGADRSSPSRALADGVAITVSATVATAPLMAHHFGSLSVAALPANLLALPAVAPAMWLGMLSAGLAQLPWIPLEPLNWLNSLCLGYIAQVARWLGSPGWAQIELGLATPLHVALAYGLLVGIAELALAAAARRLGLRGRRRAVLRRALVVVGAGAAALLLAAPALRGAGPEGSPDALVVRVLDAGQGDAILLDPPAGPAILVDTGPAGEGVADRLGEVGADTLGGVVLTHADSDHAGALAEVLSAARVERMLMARPSDQELGAAAAAGVPAQRLVEGGELRSGELRLSALWPPRELAAADDGVEENESSIVLLAEWRHFSMLLTGDAESEAVPLDPGPVDAIKLAHHGSADAGLGDLLEGTAPHLAVISVGEDNPYGHPAPETLAELESHPLETLRTDEDGEVVIEVNTSGWAVTG
jgi:competence protein ComEC